MVYWVFVRLRVVLYQRSKGCFHVRHTVWPFYCHRFVGFPRGCVLGIDLRFRYTREHHIWVGRRLETSVRFEIVLRLAQFICIVFSFLLGLDDNVQLPKLDVFLLFGGQSWRSLRFWFICWARAMAAAMRTFRGILVKPVIYRSPGATFRLTLLILLDKHVTIQVFELLSHCILLLRVVIVLKVVIGVLWFGKQFFFTWLLAWFLLDIYLDHLLNILLSVIRLFHFQMLCHPSRVKNIWLTVLTRKHSKLCFLILV